MSIFFYYQYIFLCPLWVIAVFKLTKEYINKILFNKISPDPSFPKSGNTPTPHSRVTHPVLLGQPSQEGIPPFGKGRVGGIL